jgi:hypothetical protein
MKFGEWLPDIPPLGNPGVLEAKNVFPSAVGYAPWPEESYSSDAIDGDPLGGAIGKDSDGNVFVWSGDSAKLYQLADGVFSDVSKAGAPAYALATEETWEFVQWEDTVIAASGVNAAATNNLQQLTIGGATFADLAGSPPQARHIAKVNDFIVVGNTWDGTDGAVPYRVRWGAKGDPTASWAVSAATQADFEDSLIGGWVQRIIGGEYGLVFMERAIYRMEYIGSPQVFRFDEVLPEQGTPMPGSVCQMGEHVFYISDEGFNVVANGSTVRHIGADKVDQWFYDQYDNTYFYKVSSAVDPSSHRAFWTFPGEGNLGGAPNAIICYDFHNDKWSWASGDVRIMFSSAGQGTTMDGLDSVNTNLDLITETLDSPIWQGGAPQLGLLGTNKKYGTFTGAAKADAMITTAEMQLTPGAKTRFRRLLPEVCEGTVTGRIGYRNAKKDAVSWTGTLSQNTEGRLVKRQKARYHRFELTLNSWNEATGLELEGTAAGRR